MSYSNAVILHGKPKREVFLDPLKRPNLAHWQSWAIDQLHKKDVHAVYAPTLFQAYDPCDEDMRPTFDALPLNEGSLLIGRSLGARIILEGMSRRKELVVSKVILVAPWIDPRHRYRGLEDFTIDPKIQERALGGITVFYSSLDGDEAQESLKIIREALPEAKYRDIPEYGHYMLGNTMTSEEFPELLEEI